MARSVKAVMSEDPVVIEASEPVSRVAERMAEFDVGAVIVRESDGQLCGIVTDRDVAVRVVGRGLDPARTEVGEICSRELLTLDVDDQVDDAVLLMRDNAIRRVPILDGSDVIGIVSLGDLALDRDPQSVLGNISAAPPNG